MKDLSGKWQQVGGSPADAGYYYIRQVTYEGQNDPSIIWHGHQSPGDQWSNVAFGFIRNGSIVLQWGDVTDGSNRGYGTIEVTIKDNGDTIEWVKQIAGTYFGGRKWVRA